MNAGRQHCSQNKLRDVVRSLLKRIESPERVIELYYWSQEPTLCEIMRAIAALPLAAQQSLAAFMSMAGDAGDVSVAVDKSGRLTFSSPEVARTLERIGSPPALPPGQRTH